MRFLPALAIIFLLAGKLHAQSLQTGVTFTPQDRVLVLAPHPDDETLGCGGVIQQVLDAGAKLKIVFLTNGDSNEWSFFLYLKHPVLQANSARQMGVMRRKEALKAASANCITACSTRTAAWEAMSSAFSASSVKFR